MDYVYDIKGWLSAKYFHSQNSGNFLQRIDYIYNIRGWLTQIDNPASFSENDKFGLKLYYNTAPTGGTARYNGNISGMGWGTTSNNNANANMLYRFTYDTNNRLIKADFYKTGYDFKAFQCIYAYDKNGNFENLDRRKSDGAYIDLMTFYYSHGRLLCIDDYVYDAPNVINYPGVFNGSNAFLYDNNGNMAYEPCREMETGYNLLDLPNNINHGLNRKVDYFYTFDGEKLRKTVENNGIVTKVDYCGLPTYQIL